MIKRGALILLLAGLMLPAISRAQSSPEALAATATATAEEKTGGSSEPAAEQMPPNTALTPAIIKIATLNEQFNKLDSLCTIWELGCYTGAGDTILQDEGGIRTKLAKANIGVFVMQMGVFNYNLADAPKGTRATQQFAGERPTFTYTGMTIYTTYNIPSKHMQFLIGGANMGTNYPYNYGPNTFRPEMGNLHQTLMNGKLEYIVGWQEADTEVADNYIGGSFGAGVLGVRAVIPYNLGQSLEMFTTPAVLVKYHWTKSWYTTAMVQRSTDPNTGIWGMNGRDKIGYRLFPKGDGALYEPEIGYKVDPAPGKKATFFRATGFYNTSHFLDYSSITKFVAGMESIDYGMFGKLAPVLKGLTSIPSQYTGVPTLAPDKNAQGHNGAFSITIDKQITQPDKYLAYRGIYLNSVVQYAVPDFNPYHQYYQAAVYSLGLFKARPLDMMVFNVNRTQYSRTTLNTTQQLPAALCPYMVGYEVATGQINLGGATGAMACSGALGPAVQAQAQAGATKAVQSINYQWGQPTYDDTEEISGTYSFHVMRGVYLNGNIGWTRHPAYAPKLNNPVVALFSLFTTF
jgi:porin